MNMTELDHTLRKLRLSGIADTLEIRLLDTSPGRCPDARVNRDLR